MSWVEVSLTTCGELAEAVAEFFTRYAPGAVASEQAAHGDGAASAPQITVRAYLRADANLPAIRQRIEEGLWHLSQIMPLPPAQFRPLKEDDWTQAWRAHYRPIPVGRSLLILPAWMEPPSGDRLVIRMDPGMAFGTGTHPTTRLCLLALEELLQPGQQVLDLGCGSGVLAIAAAKLGARRALALDIDPAAVRAAQHNAARNGVQQRVQVMAGSLPELQAMQPPPTFDLLLANILAPILEQLLEEGMAALLRPEGRAVLSGVLAHQADHLLQRAAPCGLALEKELAMEDWRALVLKRTRP